MRRAVADAQAAFDWHIHTIFCHCWRGARRHRRAAAIMITAFCSDGQSCRSMPRRQHLASFCRPYDFLSMLSGFLALAWQRCARIGRAGGDSRLAPHFVISGRRAWPPITIPSADKQCKKLDAQLEAADLAKYRQTYGPHFLARCDCTKPALIARDGTASADVRNMRGARARHFGPCAPLTARHALRHDAGCRPAKR